MINTPITRLKDHVEQERNILAIQEKYGENTKYRREFVNDIEYLIKENERLSREIQKANMFMDDDYMTIERYKQRLMKYETNN